MSTAEGGVYFPLLNCGERGQTGAGDRDRVRAASRSSRGGLLYNPRAVKEGRRTAFLPAVIALHCSLARCGASR